MTKDIKKITIVSFLAEVKDGVECEQQIGITPAGRISISRKIVGEDKVKRAAAVIDAEVAGKLLVKLEKFIKGYNSNESKPANGWHMKLTYVDGESIEICDAFGEILNGKTDLSNYLRKQLPVEGLMLLDGGENKAKKASSKAQKEEADQLDPKKYNLTDEDYEAFEKSGLSNIKLITHTSEFFSMAPGEKEVMQNFTVSTNGRIWFHTYKAGKAFGQITKGRAVEKSIGKGNAKLLLVLIWKFISNHGHKMMPTKRGLWTMELRFADKTEDVIHGSLLRFAETEDGIDVCDVINEVVDAKNMVLFGRVDPQLMLEEKLSICHDNDSDENYNEMLNALYYALTKKMFMSTCIMPNEDQKGENFFEDHHALCVKINDESYAAVAFTDSAKTTDQEWPGLVELTVASVMHFALISGDNVAGLILNPGTDDMFVSRDILLSMMKKYLGNDEEEE